MEPSDGSAVGIAGLRVQEGGQVGGWELGVWQVDTQGIPFLLILAAQTLNKAPHMGRYMLRPWGGRQTKRHHFFWHTFPSKVSTYNGPCEGPCSGSEWPEATKVNPLCIYVST